MPLMELNFIWFEGEDGELMPGGKVRIFGMRSLEAESSMSNSGGCCLIEMSCGMGGGRGRGRNCNAKLPASL